MSKLTKNKNLPLLRRLAALAAMALLAALLVPTVAQAATVVDSGNCGDKGDNVTWTLDSDGLLTIQGTGKMEDDYFSFVPWSRRKAVESVVIGRGVTSIGEAAFEGCSSLASVSIPKSVVSIGESAFYGCTSLASVSIPSSVTSIGKRAFVDCTSLASVSIPKSVVSIGREAFNGCSSLASVSIPEGVTSIGESAFYSCKALKSVSIPSSVTSIGECAFAYCKSLASVFIPSGVTSIGEDCFGSCDSLAIFEVAADNACFHTDGRSLVSADGALLSYASGSGTDYSIPEDVTAIGGFAFYGCSYLVSVSVPESVASIGEVAFKGCSSLASIAIPPSVSSIGFAAFEDCSSLASVSIPEGVTSIGNRAFNNCSSLTSVAIPSSVSSIGFIAFEDCSSLTSVSIPEGVTSIGRWAFSGCSSLSEVVLPKSLKRVGGYAFWDLAEGSTVYVHNSAIAKLENLISPDTTSFVLLGSKSVAVSKRVSAVSYSSLASKTCSPIASVTGAKGDRSFAKLEGAEGLSVDPATGKVKVAKGTPAGQYKLKVRVLVGPYGDRAYGLSKDVAVTVKVTRTTPLITVSKVKAAVALPVKYDKECKPIQSVTCRAGAVQSYELVAAANLTTGNSTSKVKVDPLTGKVTILKGAKAGKYSLRIKLTSPETENYKSGSKTVTCTVFVGIKG